MSDLTSRALKPFGKRERPTSTLRDAVVGKGDDGKLTDEQIAGTHAEARIAANYTAELESYAERRRVEADAQARADDELLKRVLSR